MPTLERTCGECLCYVVTNQNQGTCHRYPPTALDNSAQRYPTIKSTDVQCLEFIDPVAVLLQRGMLQHGKEE